MAVFANFRLSFLGCWLALMSLASADLPSSNATATATATATPPSGSVTAPPPYSNVTSNPYFSGPVVPLVTENGTLVKTSCSRPRLRKEWRAQTRQEKLAYLGAIKCMHDLPPRYQEYFPGVRSRYDDFVALHINATMSDASNHNDGTFLPWHRYVLWIWENTLHAECKWDGTIPYWDWPLDTPENNGTFLGSPVFHPTEGFGGDGVWSRRLGNSPNNGCIRDGPFANYTLGLGPLEQLEYIPRCLKRDFVPLEAERSASYKNVISKILARPTYSTFMGLDVGLGEEFGELGPHSVGHLGIGGEMADLFSSTNDPLFWVHHAAIDRLWYTWQLRDKDNFRDVVGSATPEEEPPGRASARHGGRRKAKVLTSLDSYLYMGVQAPDLKIATVIDPLNADGTGFLCYKYV